MERHGRYVEMGWVLLSQPYRICLGLYRIIAMWGMEMEPVQVFQRQKRVCDSYSWPIVKNSGEMPLMNYGNDTTQAINVTQLQGRLDMQSAIGCSKLGSSLALLFYVTLMLFPGLSAAAGSLAPALQEKVSKHTQKLTEWTQHPKVINALKEANLKGGLPGMTNLKWVETNESDPAIATIFTNDVSKLIEGWVAQAKGISKLYLRDKEGNLIAGDSKPVFYNSAHRPQVKFPLATGKPWAASEAKPDTTTQVNGVHLGVPVMHNGQVIGVLHTSVVAD